jgi:ankyrin repeat protein
MHCAAQYGHAGTVSLLHTHGANVNAVDEDGLSPLHMAAQYGHAATISLLIGIGGMLNLQNKVGRTVLIAAVQYGHAGTAKLLLDRKADINLSDFKASCPCCALYDAMKLVRSLCVIVPTGPHSSSCCRAVRPRWHRQSPHQLCDTPSLSLSYSASPNHLRAHASTNPTLKTGRLFARPLSTATVAPSRQPYAFQPHAPPLTLTCTCTSHANQLLLDAGASVNIQDDKGRTPLFSAARYRHAGTVALLLCRQADMNLADLKGRTPLLAAAEHGHINTINLLLEKGANYLTVDLKGRTALHEAAQNGHELCTNVLCK